MHCIFIRIELDTVLTIIFLTTPQHYSDVANPLPPKRQNDVILEKNSLETPPYTQKVANNVPQRHVQQETRDNVQPGILFVCARFL